MRGGTRTRKSPRSARRSFTPIKVKVKAGSIQKEGDEGGPISWLGAALEATYSLIVPRGAPPAPAGVLMARTSVQHDPAAAALAPAGPTVWRDLFIAYKTRKAAA